MKNEIKSKINQTLQFLRKNYWPLLVIGLPLFIILEMTAVVMNDLDPKNQDAFITFFKIIISFFMNGLAVLVFIYIISSIHSKHAFSMREVTHFIIRSILHVSLALWVIKFFAVLGFILLIIPGIYILARAATAPFLISLDNINIMTAFRLSIQYSEKQSWIMVISILILAIPSIIFLTIGYFVESQLTYSVLNIIINLSYVIEYILFYFFYLQIRSAILLRLNKENAFN